MPRRWTSRLGERNALLLAAGFAPQYDDGAWDAPVMSMVQAALSRMLIQHEPYPALIMDRHWNVLATNQAAPRFFGRFIDLGIYPTPRNLLHLVFDPAGLRPFIANWEEAAPALLTRLRREAVGQALDKTGLALLETLLAYPGISRHWRTGDGTTRGSGPVVPLRFVKDGTTLSYFSLVATIGTPRSVAAQDIRLECMVPADQETEHAHRAFLGPPTRRVAGSPGSRRIPRRRPARSDPT